MFDWYRAMFAITGAMLAMMILVSSVLLVQRLNFLFFFPWTVLIGVANALFIIFVFGPLLRRAYRSTLGKNENEK